MASLETAPLLAVAASSESTSIRHNTAELLSQRSWTTTFIWIAKYTLILSVFLYIWVMPPPPGLTNTGTHLLAVFISVILGIMLTNYPISLLVIVALLTLTATKSFMCLGDDGRRLECNRCGIDPLTTKCRGITGAFTVALSGFSLPIAWLVLCSFHLGRAVEKTGLGKRLSLGLLRWMGGSLLGLGYAIFAVECMLAPFIPSNTARGGSIIMPLVMSMVNVASASDPTLASSQFLVLCGSHSNLLSSSLFLTATIANPLIETHAKDIFDVEFDFQAWITGAIVPATICIALLPPFLLWLCGKDLKCGEATLSNRFEEEFERMGRLSLKEYQVMGVLGVCLVLWMLIDDLGIPEAFVSLCGVAALLFMETISWDEVVRNDKAWDSFFWLSGMILMAEQLSLRDIFFSSLTGHIVAMVPPFMEAGKLLQTPPFLQTGLLAYFSALSGTLTNYSSGPTVIYFGQGLITKPRWFLIGILVSLFYMTVYLSFGLAWWKYLGWF